MNKSVKNCKVRSENKTFRELYGFLALGASQLLVTVHRNVRDSDEFPCFSWLESKKSHIKKT